MIYEIFGLPRSGKTTLMTAEAQNQLNGKSILGISSHKNVFTTFYCKGCYKINFDDLKQDQPPQDTRVIFCEYQYIDSYYRLYHE